jgi:hypothetical protein
VKVKITKKTPIEEIGALVCQALAAEGIESVLTGGAVVTIYSNNEYQSYDLDFVLPGLAKNVDKIMRALGFRKERGRHWTHSDTPYFVEFPGTMLAIGDSGNVETQDLKTKAGSLRLLTPTSSVMDRLAAYYHWNDLQGLEQALALAKRHPIKLEAIKRWSKAEGHGQKLAEFLSRLKHSSL